ncbi:MAG TPA: response regulator transcription factor [Candidatus Saccharimonadales bacterium]|nr:response regulator transcription factor [Candidatus Saccharimonadales bacterium]
MTKIRIVLADDHTLVRAGIRALLESIQGVEVVAESGDGREALELIGRHLPDVALLDISMPGLNGLEVAGRVPEVSPRTRVLLLSMHADAPHVRQALRSGATGYLLKGAAVAELPLALESVMRGETYLTPRIAQTVVQELMDESGQAPDPLRGLTQRQREILQLLAEGHSTKEIAHLLDVSVKTVETHRTRLMDRLGIHDVAGLVRFAIRAGLVSPEE